MSKRVKTPPTLKATAYHEAGHAVMAWHLGIGLRRVTIIPDRDYSGQVEHAKIVHGKYLEEPTAAQGEKLALISWAGPISQQLYSPRSFRKHHARGDYIQIEDVALKVNGSIDAAEAWIRWIEIRTRDVLRLAHIQKLVRALANELLKSKTLTGKQASSFIESAFVAIANPRSDQ